MPSPPATSTRSTSSSTSSAPFAGDPAGVAAALAPLAPLHIPGRSRRRLGHRIGIAGAVPGAPRATASGPCPSRARGPRGWSGDALRDSPKDAAEHVMIVDLERNDLGRVCEPGTRPLAGADGRPTDGRGGPPGLASWRGAPAGPGLAELLMALFPGGSVTGAPKIAAIDRIARPGAGGSRRVDGRARHGPAERRPGPGADHPHVRDRGRPHPPVGGRRHRVGLATRTRRSRSRGSRRGRCSMPSATALEEVVAA